MTHYQGYMCDHCDTLSPHRTEDDGPPDGWWAIISYAGEPSSITEQGHYCSLEHLRAGTRNRARRL